MKWLARKGDHPAVSATLEELFAKCAEYGRLRLWQHEEGGWVATIKLKTDNPAVDAEINSGYSNIPMDPRVALQLVLEKL